MRGRFSQAWSDVLRGSAFPHEGQAFLEQVFSADVFRPRPDHGGREERFALTYERLRHVNDRVREAGSTVPLVQDRERLFPLLAWSAVADPALFYAMFLHHCMTTGAVLEFGAGREDLADVLEELAATERVGALLMTELGHGNSNASVRTVAEYDADREEFVLRTPEPAAVKFPPAVAAEGVPRLAVVLAQLVVDGAECGEFCFLVPLRDADGPLPGVGVRPLQPSPWLPLDGAVVSFDGVRIPYRFWLRDNAVLTADGGFTDPFGSPAIRARRTLSLIRFAWEAAVVGLAATAGASAAVAVRHAHRRRTGGRFAAGRPVIRYRNQQRALFGALSGAYVARLVAAATAGPEAPALTPRSVRTTFLMKVVTDRIAERVSARARTASGALGFLAANRFLDYQGFAHSLNAAAADNQMLLLDGAQALLAGTAYTPPADEAPAAGDRDLLDPATWETLAAVRERILHQELADGLRKATGSGLAPFDAWNGLYDLAERLAETHAARLVLGTVREAVREVAGSDPVTGPEAAGILRDLLALHALEELAGHDGWYLAEGLLDADEVRGIPALLDRLCERLEPYAEELAEALGVPYPLVGAPIAGEDYVGGLAGTAPSSGTA
ncbi:acyl-CoA dehydrogenase [Streptomyces sp. NPDC127069]|uniref:acyl-CoA dehydrogenase n=1 Tax=Streptomyces sp. NPDC127069 TaxID=3347128 RepID=UPI003663AE4F